MDYFEVKKLTAQYRKEIVPMLKKLGFDASVTSKKHYWENEINVIIKKVPQNFPVWKSLYDRYQITTNADRLKSSINSRLESLLKGCSNVRAYTFFDKKISFIEIKKEKE
jgi:hypothetical protein